MSVARLKRSWSAISLDLYSSRGNASALITVLHVTGMALNEGRDLAVVAAVQPLLGARGSRQRS